MLTRHSASRLSGPIRLPISPILFLSTYNYCNSVYPEIFFSPFLPLPLFILHKFPSLIMLCTSIFWFFLHIYLTDCRFQTRFTARVIDNLTPKFSRIPTTKQITKLTMRAPPGIHIGQSVGTKEVQILFKMTAGLALLAETRGYFLLTTFRSILLRKFDSVRAL